MLTAGKLLRPSDLGYKPLSEVAAATGLPLQVIQGLVGAKAPTDHFDAHKGGAGLDLALRLGQLVSRFEAAQLSGKPTANASGVASLANASFGGNMSSKLEVSALAAELEAKVAQLSAGPQDVGTFTRASALKIAAATARAIASSSVFKQSHGPWTHERVAELPRAIAAYAESLDSSGQPRADRAFLGGTAEIAAKALARGGDFFPALDEAIAAFNAGKDDPDVLRGRYFLAEHWVGSEKWLVPSCWKSTAHHYENSVLPALELLGSLLPAGDAKPFQRRQAALELVPPEEAHRAVKDGKVSERLALLIGGGKPVSAEVVRRELLEQFAGLGSTTIMGAKDLEERFGAFLPLLPGRGPDASGPVIGGVNPPAGAIASLNAFYQLDLALGISRPADDEPGKQRAHAKLSAQLKLKTGSSIEARRVDEAVRRWQDVDDGVWALTEHIKPKETQLSEFSPGYSRTQLGKCLDAIVAFMIAPDGLTKHRWLSKLFVTAAERGMGQVFSGFAKLDAWSAQSSAEGDEEPARLLKRLEEAANHNDPATRDLILTMLSFLEWRPKDEPLTTYERNIAVLLASRPGADVISALSEGMWALHSGTGPIAARVEGSQKIRAEWREQEIPYVDVEDRVPKGLEALSAKVNGPARQSSDGLKHSDLRQTYLHEQLLSVAAKLSAMPLETSSVAYAEARELIATELGRRPSSDALEAFRADPRSPIVAKALAETPLAPGLARLLKANPPAATDPFVGAPSDPELAQAAKSFQKKGTPTEIQGAVMFYPNFEGKKLYAKLMAAMEQTPGPTTQAKQLAVIADAGKLFRSMAEAVKELKPELHRALSDLLSIAQLGLAPTQGLASREAAIGALARGLGLILNVFMTPGKNGAEDLALGMVAAQKGVMVDVNSAVTSYRNGKKTTRTAAYYLGDTLAVSTFARAVLPKEHPASKVLEQSLKDAQAELSAGDAGAALTRAAEGVGRALEATVAGKNVMERMFYLPINELWQEQQPGRF